MVFVSAPVSRSCTLTVPSPSPAQDSWRTVITPLGPESTGAVRSPTNPVSVRMTVFVAVSMTWTALFARSVTNRRPIIGSSQTMSNEERGLPGNVMTVLSAKDSLPKLVATRAGGAPPETGGVTASETRVAEVTASETGGGGADESKQPVHARHAIKQAKKFFCAVKLPARGTPGSRQLISPPAAVLARAPASALHASLSIASNRPINAFIHWLRLDWPRIIGQPR